MELWRAAAADREGRLADELGGPLLAGASAVAVRAESVDQALASFDAQLSAERASGFVLELGRRALARAVGGSSPAAFAAELFAEAAGYYVSRDLSSHVGAAGRVPNASAAIALKTGLQALARDAVGSLGPPPTEPGEWRQFVSGVMMRLTARRR